MATKKVTIEVPDSFTAEEIAQVQDFATVKIDRILRANEVVAKELKDTNDTKIDECRVAMGLTAKYAKVEEVAEPIIEG